MMEPLDVWVEWWNTFQEWTASPLLAFGGSIIFGTGSGG